MIKKIRSGSNPPEENTLESSGFIKKQTPISERSNDTGKPTGLSLGKPLFNNPAPGFSSVREPARFDGTMTPLNDSGYGAQNGLRGLGSPDNNTSVNSGRQKSKWTGQNNNGVLGDLHSRKASNSHVSDPINPDAIGVTPRLQNSLNMIGNKSKLHSLQQQMQA